MIDPPRPPGRQPPVPGLLDVLGWDAAWADVFHGVDGAPARVVRVDRGAVRALAAAGPVAATPPVDSGLVTGDWIAVADAGASHAVTACAPRRTALVRRDPAPEPAAQTLAANMDQVWLVHAADGPLRAGWLDRALVVAYGSGATPAILISKADLARDVTALAAQARDLAPGVATVTVSVVDGTGLDTLAGRLADGRCAALLGRSGSGKSSLVNALAGVTSQRTADVRAFDAKGRHTTTRRALVPVAGGSVIDTPGLRAIGLWEPDTGLRLAFEDIAELAQRCRFNDCRHRHEPGCAVQDAVDAGELAPDRQVRFITLSGE